LAAAAASSGELAPPSPPPPPPPPPPPARRLYSVFTFSVQTVGPVHDVLELAAVHAATGDAFFSTAQLQYPWGPAAWPPEYWDDGSGAVVARPAPADAHAALLDALLGPGARPPPPLGDAFQELQFFVSARTPRGAAPLLVAHAAESEPAARARGGTVGVPRAAGMAPPSRHWRPLCVGWVSASARR
jgi:hypothetical protein